MLRPIALGLVLFGGMAGASAQPPNARLGEVIRPDVCDARMLEEMATARALLAQFEQWVFQEDGNASMARRRLDSQLTWQIDSIDRASTLTEPQKIKLRLAGRGDIKRFFDRCESVKRKYQSSEHEMQNFLREIQQDIHSLRVTWQGGLFRGDSLLVKSLRNTLTGDQFARYEGIADERRAFRHRANIEKAVALLQRGVALREAQRRELITVITNETKPSRTSDHDDYYVLLLQIGRLPEEKLKPLFGETQWKIVSWQLAQFKELEPMLKQPGQLAGEDDEADRANAPPAPKK
jgi:hypothetical protein